MLPAADARGRIVVKGAQAVSMTIRCGQYVNLPEGELFHKSAILRAQPGPHGDREAAERAVVGRGNTDVIALRQAGFEPVVASMGRRSPSASYGRSARLTRRVYACFGLGCGRGGSDSQRNAACDEVELDVRVVPLPKVRILLTRPRDSKRS